MNFLPVRSALIALLIMAALAEAVDAPSERLVPLLETKASAQLVASSREPESCVCADLANGESGILYAGAALLQPGRFRLHAALAAAPLGTLGLSIVRIRLRAGNDSRVVSVLQFAADDEFVDLTLDFSTGEAGRLPISIEWQVEQGEKSKGLLGQRALEVAKAQGTMTPGARGAGLVERGSGLDADLGLELEDTAAERPVAEARRTPYRLLATGVHLEQLSPLSVRVIPEKVVFRRGEPGNVTVELQNRGTETVAAQWAAALVVGLRAPAPLATGSVTLAPGRSQRLQLPDLFATQPLHWGGEVQLTVTAANLPPAVGRGVFAVSDNIWETAIIAAGPHTGDFRNAGDADAAAAKLRDQGFTGFECFFWAPCDLLDFTPDEELFFSGQTAYPQTISGTRNFVEACHRRGLGATFYANLWGGSGPPAFEVMRRHPEWFGNANYLTFVLDDWDLLGPSQAEMSDRQVRAPGIAQWCFNQLDIVPPEGVFRYHAEEILASRRQFGWDGIRYDSYYSRYWSVRALRLIRGIVGAAAPAFCFGYNSFAAADHRALALDDMLGDRGLIMAEGIRIERSQDLLQFAHEVMNWRDMIWAYGGHGPGLLFRPSTDEEEMTPLGIEHQAIIILAAGGHLYYNPIVSDRADYPRFALRYSEYLWDNRLRPLSDAAGTIEIPAGIDLLAWERLARTRELDDHRQRLILHLIPKPVATNPFKDKTMKVPAPVRQLPISVRLPAGATATELWQLDPAARPQQKALSLQQERDAVHFTVPDVGLWSVIVLEFSGGSGLPAPVSLKQKTDTYIQDWLVLGPYPNDLQMTAVETPYPPEHNPDPGAAYAQPDGQPLRWIRNVSIGAPALGRLPLDFRDALNLHDGRPGCAYALTTITSDRARELRLMGKADDTLRLWLNGDPLAFEGGLGEFQDSHEGAAVVKLLAGPNTVLAKVCEKWLYWLLALRLADVDGNPAAGVSIAAPSVGDAQ